MLLGCLKRTHITSAKNKIQIGGKNLLVLVIISIKHIRIIIMSIALKLVVSSFFARTQSLTQINVNVNIWSVSSMKNFGHYTQMLMRSSLVVDGNKKRVLKTNVFVIFYTITFNLQCCIPIFGDPDSDFYMATHPHPGVASPMVLVHLTHKAHFCQITFLPLAGFAI